MAITVSKTAVPAPALSAPLTFPDSPYRLYETFQPAGDQPEAIDKLVAGLRDGLAYQTLGASTATGPKRVKLRRRSRPASLGRGDHIEAGPATPTSPFVQPSIARE